jgi:hypothetical protein
MNKTKSSWRTTLMGILTLLAAGWGVYKHPQALTDPQQQAVLVGALATGVGLIAAKDASKGQDAGAAGDSAAPPA